MKLPVLLSLTWMARLSAAEPAADSVIGRIGDLNVRASDVQASIAALGPQEEATVNRDPALLNQMVRSLLVQRLLLKEAESKGHDQKPEVAAQLARAREVALTESYLAAVSQPPAAWPAEADVKAAYEKAKPSILVPKSWRLAQVFVSLPKGAGTKAVEQAQVKLEAVRKLLKAEGADFSKIAAEHSEEEAGAGRGGEIGWLAGTQIQAGIREKLDSLKVDSVSEPIRLDDGWHIVKVLDSREPYTPALEQVREQLAGKLRAEKSRANSEAYLAKLLQENPPAINEIALSRLAEDAKK